MTITSRIRKSFKNILQLPNNGNENLEIFHSYIFPCLKLITTQYSSFGLFTLADTDFDPDPGVDTRSKNG